jgi:hypothetical protein
MNDKSTVETSITELSLALEIERFLSGESDGAMLLSALYGSAFYEPIPPRLLAVLRDEHLDTTEAGPPALCAAAS